MLITLGVTAVGLIIGIIQFVIHREKLKDACEARKLDDRKLEEARKTRELDERKLVEKIVSRKLDESTLKLDQEKFKLECVNYEHLIRNKIRIDAMNKISIDTKDEVEIEWEDISLNTRNK